jgi:hypothetical protein
MGTCSPVPDDESRRAFGGSGLSGSVTIDRSPNVAVAWVAITGVGPDGRRYIISGPSFDSTAFTGTAWDWLAAIIEGR